MVYVVAGVIIGIFVGVVVVISKKDAKELEEMTSKLTQEQKNRLMATEVQMVEENAWVQEAYVARATDKGGKVDLRMLWYNKVMENNEFQTITIADAKISKAEQEAHNVKEGSFVKLYIAPEKTVGSVKVVFD